jgi:ferric-dicitrate binding protein FerR (iron transport regulator)
MRKRRTVTKRINRHHPLDPLTRDALAWIVRLTSGDATQADAELLLDWRARSPKHEQAYRDAVKSWRAIGAGLVSDRPATIARRRRKSTIETRRKP